jgi:hypothetical protein
MAPLKWDQVGERLFETGVDHGVLYIPDETGAYDLGVAWNGLVTVTESPSGAAANPQYADNIKYLNLIAAEEFGGTIDAFTYPDEFAQCDGTAVVEAGLTVGQQSRKVFGLSFRSRVGNDIDGTDHGYKLHMIYGAQAAPSDRAYGTINDQPAAISFSWTITTSPVPVSTSGLKPTALVTVDSTKVDAATLADLEDILYGTGGVEARLPLPDEVIALFGGTAPTPVRLTGANAPTYDSGTHVVTIPAVAGVDWTINDVDAAAGAQPAMTAGQSSYVKATPQSGHVIEGDDDWTFDY